MCTVDIWLVATCCCSHRHVYLLYLIWWRQPKVHTYILAHDNTRVYEFTSTHSRRVTRCNVLLQPPACISTLSDTIGTAKSTYTHTNTRIYDYTHVYEFTCIYTFTYAHICSHVHSTRHHWGSPKIVIVFINTQEYTRIYSYNSICECTCVYTCSYTVSSALHDTIETAQRQYLYVWLYTAYVCICECVYTCMYDYT